MNPTKTLLLSGAAVLAASPAAWLIQSWRDTAANGQGLMIAGLTLALMLWSASSRRCRTDSGSQRRALWLIGLTMVVRLLGQILGINVLGALALVVDVYALGLLLGLSGRQRALSAGWLALLFAFSLPVERIFLRTIGFGLQQLSAAGACGGLQLLGFEVECVGLRILLAGQDLLVDLPCSGARSLVTLLAACCGLAAVCRPSLAIGGVGLVVTLMGAYLANVVRLMLLALGLAFPALIGGASVMEAPWHELIGLSALALGLAPLIIWAMRISPSDSLVTSKSLMHQPRTSGPVRSAKTAIAGLFFFCALVIVMLPARPVDIAQPQTETDPPAWLLRWPGQVLPLSPLEQRYYTRYGGGAARASYGPFTMLKVSTTAPLRHLHEPGDCLRGAGHEVRYVGLEFADLPTAIYRSTDPEGRQWRIAVSYLDADGQAAASIAEVVWRWLAEPGMRWTMVQRIAPWAHPQALEFDTAVARALDLPAASGAARRLHLVEI